MRKPHVVAGGESDLRLSHRDHDWLRTRRHCVGFAEPERIEKVNLVVVSIHTWPDGAQRIVDPTGIPRSEHASHDNELMMFSNLAQVL